MKIFLASDVHLGMKFAGHLPSVQEKLIEARFEALKRCVDIANDRDCELFVVGGDLFDRVSVVKSDIQQAAEILGDFQGRLVAVLPGNHDFITQRPDGLWATFKSFADNHILILESSKIYPLKPYDLCANLYAAPCESKHSPKNCIGWIRTNEKDENVRFHIGVAHGSLEGFSLDFHKTYYPMNIEELNECKLDLWLLGHTHMQYPKSPGVMDRIYFSGTPEPDGFDCNHEGKSWIIEIDDEKNISARSIFTGTFRFLQDEIEVRTIDDIEALKTRYGSPEFKKTLLRLKIKGRLPEETYNSLATVREVIEKQVFYLHWDDSLITRKITPSDIKRMFTKDSFPYTLLMNLTKSEEDFEALHEASDLINEVMK